MNSGANGTNLIEPQERRMYSREVVEATEVPMLLQLTGVELPQF
jgi:hypothetical protein